MKKITFATVVSSALAALAIGFAGPALADAGSGSNRAAAWRPRTSSTRSCLPRGEPVHSLRRRPLRPVRRVGPALTATIRKTCRPASAGGIFSGGDGCYVERS